jgi:leucyl aminopeptidase (aminopeptidase T)
MTQQASTIVRSKNGEQTETVGYSKPVEYSNEIASRLVNTCLRIGPEDVVVIETTPHMVGLATQVSIECYKTGADAEVVLHSDDAFFSVLETQTPERLSRASKAALAMAQIMTVNISLVTLENPERLRNVRPEKMAALSRSRIPVEEVKLKRKVKSAYLGLSDTTQKRAETYGLNLAGWRRAVENASSEDYSELAQFGAKIRELLSGRGEVHIRTPEGTDLKFKLAGRSPRLNDGIIDDEDVKNGAYSIVIPAGDVSVAMDETSAEGRFISNVHQPWLGRWVEGLEWQFKNGKVVGFDAKNNLSALKAEYEASKGDKDRIGVLYLGLNKKAVSGQLFNLNQIASGTISIGIGDNKKLDGANHSEFEFISSIDDGTLTVDGQTIIKNGKYAI